MHSLVTLPPALRRRPFLRAWLLLSPTATTTTTNTTAWLLVLSLVATCVAAMPHQDFPQAAEEYHYVFRADGTYSFSYDTGTGKHQSFRLEARDAKGRVSGRYGYIDPDGVLRITMYQADATGYRANMVIYRKVTSAPPQPLLVGPLPRSVSFKDTAGRGRKPSPGEPSAPIGPVPFFSPQDGPILVIGPLPKPLQPQRDDDEGDTSATLDVSLSSSEKDLLVESSGIRDVPEGPPPNAIPSRVLETILQDNFHKIFRGSLPAILVNSEEGGSFRISLNSLEEGTAGDGQQPESSQEDLVKISQELLRGPEARLGATKAASENEALPLRVSRRNRTRSEPSSNEGKLARVPFADTLNASQSFSANTNHTDSNRTFEVPVREEESDSRHQNPLKEKQNYSLNSQMIAINAKLMPPSSERVNKTAHVPSSTEDKNKDSRREASFFPFSVDAATTPPRTYLPAHNIKVPRQSIYVGSLPSY
ncbi:uncharacterized protein LOC135214344 isoform X2 [Macrobrachium nipponense]|uniref:uncharacterized protein LOC135214344 isoform X2 n=1 Tax=Macrobrachium nipponense TaxID=159736 RepID=UPI0030C8A8E1